MNKKDTPDFGQLDDTRLTFKDHQQFFDAFYQYRNEYLALFYESVLDLSQTEATFKALFKFISCCISQTSMQIDFEEINKYRNEILQLLQKKKRLEALSIMDSLFIKVSKAHQELELTPKPNEIKDSEEVKFWKEESHQGLREIKKGFMDVLSIKNE